MPIEDPNVRRAKDRERYHRRVAERVARGLCPKCGKRTPAPDRSICEPCAERARAAGRARDARLRTAGKPRRDKKKARAYERARSRRQAAERIARGMCTKCGSNPVESGRRLCEPCAAKRREYDRSRYAEARNRGELYGGRNPQVKRKAARVASRKRRKARLDANACARCGRRPPVDGGTTCAPCRMIRQAAERELYAARRAARMCTRCGGPTTDGGSVCAPCAVLEAECGRPQRKNARSRQRYWERREASRCTDCNAPSHGASRCEPCAKRSYERSDHVRGMPLYPPEYTIVNPATGEDLGTCDSWEEVAMCLAFERLDIDEVEVLVDQSPLASLTAWA